MSEKFENDLSIYALVIINYVRINRLETVHILFNINIGSLSMLIIYLVVIKWVTKVFEREFVFVFAIFHERDKRIKEICLRQRRVQEISRLGQKNLKMIHQLCINKLEKLFNII